MLWLLYDILEYLDVKQRLHKEGLGSTFDMTQVISRVVVKILKCLPRSV